MEQNLAQEAISAALAGEWEKALELNKEILKENKKDVDALNRTARAYAELGDIKKAKKTAQKVIKIEPFNKIAERAHKKWKGLRSGSSSVSGPSSAQAFLEEPGKTKIVSLLHLGASLVLAKLDSGDEVELVPHRHRVSVNTKDGKYIGRLADDIAARLRKLIRAGNEYQVLVKSIEDDELKIFIRETKRAEKIANIPSFSSEKIDYVSFTPPELVHKKGESIQPNENEE